MDVQLMQQNRVQVSEEVLRQHQGKYVAFSPDGASIVASGESWDSLAADISEKGLNPDGLWLDYIGGDDRIIRLQTNSSYPGTT